MLKLMNAEYRRLFKSKIFLFELFGCFAAGLIISGYDVWMKNTFGDVYSADNNLFIFPTFCGILCAVLTSLFIGKLYSDGTVRNLIIAGHSRKSVFLCEYLVTLCADVLFFFAFVFGRLIISCPVFKSFNDSPKMLAIKTLLTITVIAVYTAVFVLIAVLNRNKAAVAIVCLLSAFGLLFYSMIINNLLAEPEIYEEHYYYDTENDELIKEEAMPNPNYVGGTKRVVYEFLNDFLPAGQSFQIGGNYDAPTVKSVFLIYDLCTVFICCLVGMLIFRKKDLK